jgi:hypothetical protein
MTHHPVLDDPGELFRFWLWHRFHHTVQSFSQSNLAKALGVKAATVSAWLDRYAIPTNYWTAIATHFERGNWRDLEDEAKTLWGVAANRRDYTPLYKLQKKRAETSSPAAQRRVSRETPERVTEYLRGTDEAKTPRQRRPSAPPVGGRSKRGTRPAD